MIKNIERYQFEHINTIKNVSIRLNKKFLYTFDEKQKQIVEKLRKVVEMEKQKRLVGYARKNKKTIKQS